jgi:hypothetical protein
LPSLAPTTFLPIGVLAPSSGVYNYDLPLLIEWRTRGDAALKQCGYVMVYLYQKNSAGVSYKAREGCYTFITEPSY